VINHQTASLLTQFATGLHLAEVSDSSGREQTLRRLTLSNWKSRIRGRTSAGALRFVELASFDMFFCVHVVQLNTVNSCGGDLLSTLEFQR
jgi:hypothetical protein